MTGHCRTVRPCTSHTGRTTSPAQSSASSAPGRWARASPRSRSKPATRSCSTTSTRRRIERGVERGSRTGLERRAREARPRRRFDRRVGRRAARQPPSRPPLDAVAAAEADVVIEAAARGPRASSRRSSARSTPRRRRTRSSPRTRAPCRSRRSRRRRGHRSGSLGLHFFNPAPVMPLVEVVRGPPTDARGRVERATALVERWGKTPVRGRRRAGLHRQPRQPAVHARGAADARSGRGERRDDRARDRVGRATRWARSS